MPRVFGRKPVAIAGASPGGLGTVLSQNAWLPVFRTIGASLYTDAAVKESVAKFIAGFVAHLRGG